MKKQIRGVFLTLLILLAGYMPGVTQVLDPNDLLLDYYKTLELKNPSMQERINIHPTIVNGYQKDSLEWNPWKEYLITLDNEKSAFQIIPFRTKASFNLNYPRSYNDGAVWQGKGLTIQAQTGFTGRYGKIRYTFAPIAYWSQNQAFDLAANSNNEVNPFNYQFNSRGFIDYVQRFGSGSFVDFHPGQSEIRAVFNWFTFGLSTQNIVFGPAQRNSILLGNSGGMMPHVDLGTDHPVNTPVGQVELKLYWGRMHESNYNNALSTNPNQYFSAGSFGYSPKWIKGLYFGINRIFYKRWQDFVFTDYLTVFTRTDPPNNNLVFGNDDLDQMGSFTMRWSFPEVGFESYFEMAKNDFGGNFFLSSPEHSRAITLGFVKLLEFDNDVTAKLSYEHTTIGQPKNSFIRNYNRYFSHATVRNGLTHRGQLLGAGIGPGSNGDWADMKIYFKKSMIGGTAQRIRFDDDYFFENFTEQENHDYEWSIGAQYEQLLQSGRLGFEATYSIRQSRYFISGYNTYNFYLAVSFVKPF